MKPKKIKLFWTVGLLVTLLASAAVSLPILWPRLFPSLYVSDLYRRYENNDYIRATEIHNFPVNDTLATDALLLEAATDSAWYALLADFGVPEEMIEMYMTDTESLVGDNKESIVYLFRDKNNFKKRQNKNNPDSRLVIGSLAKKALCIYITDDETMKDIIGLLETKKLKNE